MARIRGVASGLVAGSINAPERKAHRVPERSICKLCGGVLPQRKRSSLLPGTVDEEFDGACRYCVKIFGVGGMADEMFGRQSGVTNLSAEECITRIDALRNLSWGIILRAGTFGTEGGQVVEIEPGDIVKIHRAGLSTAADAMEYCSYSRSKERFTIEIMIGPLPLILWPHEIAAISFLTIMDLKKAGEIEESFVAQEDECGYFKPHDVLREEIYHCFGSLTGGPP